MSASAEFYVRHYVGRQRFTASVACGHRCRSEGPHRENWRRSLHLGFATAWLLRGVLPA